VYLLDDRSTLYMHVGRAVPAAVIDELFETIHTPQGRKDSVSFRTSSLLARRMCALVDLLRASNPHKPDLKVLWAGLSSNDPLTIKFSSRLVEDSNLGLMSYVDYLCNLHTKIKDAQP
jgi:chemotaxis protein histidine kinase CheA